MCDYNDQAGVSNAQVSEADKEMIVNAHNNYRAGVSPPASNMMKMVCVTYRNEGIVHSTALGFFYNLRHNSFR